MLIELGFSRMNKHVCLCDAAKRMTSPHSLDPQPPLSPFARNGFPVDVLLIVLRYLLPMIRKPTRSPFSTDCWDESDLAYWPTYDRSMPDVTVTESLASVSPLWRETMSLIPSFWTRLVIWVGKDATPLRRVREYLAWSHDYPLDIYVLQNADASKDVASDPALTVRVKAQVDAAFELLNQHMKRWRILRIELVNSTTIPRPRVELIGRGDMLKKMELLFDVDDQVADVTGESPALAELHVPELVELVIGGLHFHELYVMPLDDFPMPPVLSSIRIFNYDARHPPFPIHDLLSCLVSCDLDTLQDVELDNLHLDCSDFADPVIPDDSELEWNAEAQFTDMSADAIAEYHRLLVYPLTECVGYTRCSTADHYAPLSDCNNITLSEVNDPMAILGLLVPRPDDYQNSTQLASFYNCAGLSAEVFSTLALPAQITGRREWLCPALGSLTIVGCKSFRSADVRRFVEARHKANMGSGLIGHDPLWTVNPVYELVVRDCCALSPEDEEWFRKNVDIFHWC